MVPHLAGSGSAGSRKSTPSGSCSPGTIAVSDRFAPGPRPRPASLTEAFRSSSPCPSARRVRSTSTSGSTEIALPRGARRHREARVRHRPGYVGWHLGVTVATVPGDDSVTVDEVVLLRAMLARGAWRGCAPGTSPETCCPPPDDPPAAAGLANDDKQAEEPEVQVAGPVASASGALPTRSPLEERRFRARVGDGPWPGPGWFWLPCRIAAERLAPAATPTPADGGVTDDG